MDVEIIAKVWYMLAASATFGVFLIAMQFGELPRTPVRMFKSVVMSVLWPATWAVILVMFFMRRRDK